MATSELLDRFKPAWAELNCEFVEVLTGHSLELVLFKSSWDVSHVVVKARSDGLEWTTSFSFDDLKLKTVIEPADNGIDGDIGIAWRLPGRRGELHRRAPASLRERSTPSAR